MPPRFDVEDEPIPPPCRGPKRTANKRTGPPTTCARTWCASWASIAQSCSRSHSVFGAFYRARSARSSSEEAVVATAHKIARVLYHVLTCREAFKPESIRDFDVKRQQKELKHLQKRAKALGFALQPLVA